MSSTPQVLVDVEHVRSGVDASLERHLEALGQELAGLGHDAAELVDAVRLMLEGGKRLRAAFCYWSWRAHGGQPDAAPHGVSRDSVLRIGAALELFQAAALFHDDVMDDSDTRRGRRSAHLRFADNHRELGWAGSSRRFGESAAILLGDLALIASEREFASAVALLDVGVRADAQRVFDTMRTEVTVGQYLDVLAQALPWASDPPADEARAREVIRAKSARYSVEHPIVLGAVLAGASHEQVARCRTAGLALGEAFQLRDDMLGVFGDPGATGKPAGDDLREGKRTVLVARTLQRAPAEVSANLVARLGDRTLDAEDIEELRQDIVHSGAVAEVEELISALGEPALGSIAASALAEPGRSMLVDLGRVAIHRDA